MWFWKYQSHATRVDPRPGSMKFEEEGQRNLGGGGHANLPELGYEVVHSKHLSAVAEGCKPRNGNAAQMLSMKSSTEDLPK